MRKGIELEELKNGKWIAYLSGRVETALAKGNTSEEAEKNLINYLASKTVEF